MDGPRHGAEKFQPGLPRQAAKNAGGRGDIHTIRTGIGGSKRPDRKHPATKLAPARKGRLGDIAIVIGSWNGGSPAGKS